MYQISWAREARQADGMEQSKRRSLDRSHRQAEEGEEDVVVVDAWMVHHWHRSYSLHTDDGEVASLMRDCSSRSDEKKVE